MTRLLPCFLLLLFIASFQALKPLPAFLSKGGIVFRLLAGPDIEGVQLYDVFHLGRRIPTKALIRRNQQAKWGAPISKVIVAFDGVATGTQNLCERMAEQSVRIRNVCGYRALAPTPEARGWARVSIGTSEQNTAFLSALEHALADERAEIVSES